VDESCRFLAGCVPAERAEFLDAVSRIMQSID
jgi:hypothetical protein